jgi:uncharacterized membrane protein YsdA (DUF1294 family)
MDRKVIFYATSINIASFGLFGYDKHCAQKVCTNFLIQQQKLWRVPEATLCLSAAMGGWAGGLIAMQKFKHKTKKKSFQVQYFAACAGNIALAVYLLV